MTDCCSEAGEPVLELHLVGPVGMFGNKSWREDTAEDIGSHRLGNSRH
jgi:hypothetical protein